MRFQRVALQTEYGAAVCMNVMDAHDWTKVQKAYAGGMGARSCVHRLAVDFDSNPVHTCSASGITGGWYVAALKPCRCPRIH